MNRTIRTVASVLMIGGGLSLLLPLAIDYVGQRAYTLVFLLQALGFVMILGASLLSLSVFEHTLARAMFVSGTALWLLCWSGFLIGYFVPIPLAFWAALASLAFLTGVAVCLIRHEWTSAILASVLAGGSICSTLVMLLAAASLVSPDYSYVFFALGAVAGGVLLVTLKWSARTSHDDGASPGFPAVRS